MNIEISKKQKEFIETTADEVLFGGAAGGGKSYGQLIDAFLYALKYQKSKQLILRRTFAELEKSLIRTALDIFPTRVYKYNASKHLGTFPNGSIIDFGYCDSENDVVQYQSAEYDMIRFDELTHFTEDMYVYLISRLRGANSYPKQMKSSTNPGGIGHQWVKDRFIDIGAPNTLHQTTTGSRIFIPSKVTDNRFLLDKDPDYIQRLTNLNEQDQKALLYGDWDLDEGRYFTEWQRDIHVIKPFSIPSDWRRYFAMDYGLDMFAAYWVAVDNQGRAYVYKEFCQSNLIISDAAAKIKQLTEPTERIHQYIAPPDMWNRRQDSGKSVADLFAMEGIHIVKASNDRVQGWYNMKEWLKPTLDETGATIANLRVFDSCPELIKCIPALQISKKNPSDVASEPHEYTHSPDAIRYFLAGRPIPNYKAPEQKHYNFSFEKPRPSSTGYGDTIKVI